MEVLLQVHGVDDEIDVVLSVNRLQTLETCDESEMLHHSELVEERVVLWAHCEVTAVFSQLNFFDILTSQMHGAL